MIENNQDEQEIAQKKNIVFFCSHHSGHINPILSLARRFTGQDTWAVHFFSDPTVKHKIESVGAIFHPIDDGSHGKPCNVHEASAKTIEERFQLQQSPEVAGYFFPLEILPATVYYLDPQRHLVERVQRLQPHAVVCDVSALWGILTAKMLKLPLITSCSCTLFESLQPPFGHFREIDFLKASAKWLLDTYKIQYDPMVSYMNESDFTVSFSTPIFQPPSRRDSPNVRYFGPPVSLSYEDFLEEERARDRSSKEESSILKWLEAGKAKNPNRKVIYCSLGTVVGQEPWTIMERTADDVDMVGCFYEKVFEVMREAGDKYQCIVSIGKHRRMIFQSPLPENVRCFPVVPQVMVLQEADAFITHCGNNGVHEAFFAKTPMVCVPVFGDQHPNADSISKLNAGVLIESPFAPLPSPNLDHVTTKRIDEALEELFVTRKDVIEAGITEISHSMRAYHQDYKNTGYDQMMSFIESA